MSLYSEMKDEVMNSGMSTYEKMETLRLVEKMYDIFNKIYDMSYDEDVRNYMRSALGWED